MISDAESLACEYPAQLALTRWLAQRNYYAEYQKATWGGFIPRGMSGSELWAISLEAEKENKNKFRQDPLGECVRRGAL